MLALFGGDHQRARESFASAGADPVAQGLHARLLLLDGHVGAAIELLEKAGGSAAHLTALLVEAKAMSGEEEKARELFSSIESRSSPPRTTRSCTASSPSARATTPRRAHYEAAVDADSREPVYAFRLGYPRRSTARRTVRSRRTSSAARPRRSTCARSSTWAFSTRTSSATTKRVFATSRCSRRTRSNPRATLYFGDAEASSDMYYDREKEKERSRRNQLLQIPITDFRCRSEARNCLQKMDIHTLGDLIKKTESELLSYKNFGETSLSEIKRILAQKGFRLGQGADVPMGAAAVAAADSEHQRAMSEPVSVLELSSRSQRCMDRLGIETLADLTKRSELELISQKNFGVTSLNEVKRKLKERGLGLATS